MSIPLKSIPKIVTGSYVSQSRDILLLSRRVLRLKVVAVVVAAVRIDE